MRKITAIILLGTLLTFSACGSKPEENNEKLLREHPAKEVTVFTAGETPDELFIEKTGSSSAESFVSLSPEINGKIQNLKVQVGDEVRAGQILATIGDSSTSDQIDLQYNTAKESEKLARISEELTKYAASQNIDAAQLGVIAARTAHENALKSRENILDSFELQYQNGEIESENAELSLENAEDSLEKLEDLYYDSEDLLDDAALDQLENQIDNAEIAVDLAENRYEQSRIALDQLETATQSQLNQIESAIENSIIQYQSAINQLESAQAGAQLQKIGAETQSLQSESNLKNSRIAVDRKNLKSPISGRITAIEAKNNQSVSPGQTIFRIENDDLLIIQTSINAEESALITKNSTVEILYNKKTFAGKILNISPSLDPTTNKINLEIEANKNLKLPTGAFVKVRIAINADDTFFIPLNSVFLNEGQKTVRTIDAKNRVKYQPVEIGEIVGNFVEILSGLKQGDQIITSVDKFLSEDEKVKPINERK